MRCELSRRRRRTARRVLSMRVLVAGLSAAVVLRTIRDIMDDVPDQVKVGCPAGCIVQVASANSRPNHWGCPSIMAMRHLCGRAN